VQVGPITLMKTKTFADVLSRQTLLWEENSRLANELGIGGTTHSFMHYPWNATTAPTRVLEPDHADIRHTEAVTRVIEAYQQAMKEQVTAAPCMWDDIGSRNNEFLKALEIGKFPDVSRILSHLFQSPVIWGLGKFDNKLLEDVQKNREKSHLQLRITDALVSLAQATGAARLTCVEQQGIEPHIKALQVNLAELLEATEERAGFEISSPEIGATYGCIVNNKLVTLDGVINAYIAYRLRQLGVGNTSNVVEIGGGFGCLAEIVFRYTGCPYFIYDLPWVAAIQGYFLIMSLPPGSIKLLGESAGQVEVMPFWRFSDWPERSIDFLVNSDSLPEMGFETASDYVRKIAIRLRGLFLSINQEAMAMNAEAGRQNCVHSLVSSTDTLSLKSRSLYWMRQGYVEEVYAAIH